MFWKLFMIALFVAVTVFIGVVCRNKNSTVGDFVLGGRSIGPWLTAFAYGTTYFSAVVFVGYAGQFGWQFGISAFWIGVGNALIGSLLAWVILGKRTRIMTTNLGSSTMPDFFERRYDSRTLRIFASLITFVFLIPYSASVYKGLSGLFMQAFSESIPGFNMTWCILLMAVLTALYIVIGGYKASAINSFVQGIIMLVGIVLVVYYVLAGKGGFSAAIDALSQLQSESAPEMAGAFTSMFGPSPLDLLSVFVLTSLGAWGLPQMVHKFYTIKDERSIMTGTVISTIFALVVAGGSYFMGGFGRLYYTPAEGETNIKMFADNIVPVMLESVLPDIVIGIVLVLVLSASMSTLSSLVITSSSTFVLDFAGIFKKNKDADIEKTARRNVFFMRIMCVAFVLLSVVIALRPTALITSLMSLSWGALAGAFLGPFMYGLFWKGTTKASVYASFIVGIAIPVVNLFVPFATPLAAGAISIIASLIVVPVVSLITPKMNKDAIERIFQCYDKKETAPVAGALTEEAK